MAGYIGTKAVLLSTTAATVTGDMTVGGAATISGPFTSKGIDDNATSTAMTLDASGNVGIGTASTTAGKLVVDAGTTLVASSFTSSNPTYGVASTWQYGATRIGEIGSQGSISGGGSLTEFALNAPTSLVLNTGYTERMRIDASGRVTMPYQPAFKAGMDAATFSTGASSTQIVYNFTHFDRGGHYNTSTGRYTIPVTGLYVFTHNISARATYSGAFEVKLFQNGAEKHRQFTFGGGFGHGATATAILSCTQGDYIDARGYWGTSGMSLSGDLDVVPPAGTATLSYFSGYLIG